MEKTCNPHWRAIALALLLLPAGAQAQTSVSSGLEFRTGDYGRLQSTDEWRLPFALRHSAGDWVFRAGTAYSRIDGFANAVEQEARRTDTAGLDPDEDDVETDEDEDGGAGGGGAGGGGGTGVPVPAGSTARSASGFGDANLSAFFRALRPNDAGFGLDAGVRTKVPVAPASECLLTTGEIDYSVEAKLYRPIGKLEPSLTLGWTKRGDPLQRDSNCDVISGRRVDYRNPFYVGVGLGIELTRLVTLDLDYLYRERLRPGSQPLSEARASLQFRLSDGLRLGIYGAAGLTNAGPAWIVGTSVGYRF